MKWILFSLKFEREMLRTYLKNIRKLLVEFNLFENDPVNIEITNRGRLATRIYAVTLVGLLLIIGWFAAFVVRTVENIVYSPSLSHFEYLLQKYPSTLRCPCKKWTISYEKFVTVDVQYHQVCSSQFIEPTWIDLIYMYQNITLTYSTDVQSFLSSFWQIVASLCLVSKQSLVDALVAFHQETFLTPTAVSKSYIIAQAQSALITWLEAAETQLVTMIYATQSIMIGNQLISGLGTNIYFQRPTSLSSLTIGYTYTRQFKNCSCLHVNGCPRTVSAFDQSNGLIPVPGLIMDCSLTRATLRSTLECYYNQTCLSLIHGHHANNLEALSVSKNKHFLIDTMIETLVNNLMIDHYTIDVSLDLYYDQCNPSYCYYKYNRQFQVLFIITVMCGIYGILSTLLRFLIPWIVKKLMHRESHSPTNQSGRVKTSFLSRQSCKLLENNFQYFPVVLLF